MDLDHRVEIGEAELAAALPGLAHLGNMVHVPSAAPLDFSQPPAIFPFHEWLPTVADAALRTILRAATSCKFANLMAKAFELTLILRFIRGSSADCTIRCSGGKERAR